MKYLLHQHTPHQQRRYSDGTQNERGPATQTHVNHVLQSSYCWLLSQPLLLPQISVAHHSPFLKGEDGAFRQHKSHYTRAQHGRFAPQASRSRAAFKPQMQIHVDVFELDLNQLAQASSAASAQHRAPHRLQKSRPGRTGKVITRVAIYYLSKT